VSTTTGLIFDLPFADYLQIPAWSQSTIKQGQRSMLHAKAAYDDAVGKEPTDAMLLGSAVHTTFLEPELATEAVAVWPKRRAGKEWEAFRADNADKTILTETQHAHLVGMVRQLRKHPEVKRWLGKIDAVEASAVADVNGVRCKGRADALTSDPLIDLKTVADGDIRKFTNNAYDFGYHIQAALYRRLFDRSDFVLMTVESSPPYDVVPYRMTPMLLAKGDEILDRLLEKIAKCEKDGHWPGRSDSIKPLNLPAWVPEAEHTNTKAPIKKGTS
jgi:hypothetical protein